MSGCFTLVVDVSFIDRDSVKELILKYGLSVKFKVFYPLLIHRQHLDELVFLITGIYAQIYFIGYYFSCFTCSPFRSRSHSFDKLPSSPRHPSSMRSSASSKSDAPP